VVLLILGIAAGAVALKVAGPLSRLELDGLADRISQFDALTRRYACEHDRRVCLLVDLSKGRVSRIDPDGGTQLGGDLALPEGVRIAAVIVAGRRTATGRVSIGCSRRGLTPSYAMLLADADGGRRRILTAGLTGQMIQLDGDETIREIFEALRPDAG